MYLHSTNPSVIIDKFSQDFTKKLEHHGLSYAGFGHSANRNAISHLSIIFRTNRSLNLSQAREFALEIISLYLNAINQDPKLGKILKPYPFSKQNIKINIDVENSDCEFDGQITMISFYKNTLRFRTNRTNYFDKIDIFNESYEDAVALVNVQKTIAE